MFSGPSTSRALALFLALGGLTPAFGETGPAPAIPHWRDFRSEAGRFRVELPAAPRIERSEHGTLMGPVIEVGFFAGWADREVVVIYEDIPAAARWVVPPSVILGRAAASLLEDAGGQEIESLQSKWRGHPARKLRYSLAGSVAQQVRVRLLLVESRLYLLMARWPLAEAMPPEVERFWASFQVEDR